MKILVTGNYKDGHSGWSRATSEFILALDAAGATVVPRSYKLNQDPSDVNSRILELEENDELGTDVVFHIGLPHNYRRPKCKSASFLFVETDNFSDSPWARQLNCTSDLVLVPNDDALVACVKSGVTVPVKKCYVPTDISLYENTEIIPELKAATHNDFLFYFIGEMTARKGIHHLIKAFHLEFTPNEPVSLVIKTGKYGVPEQELKDQFSRMAKEVKDSLKLRTNYKPEILITDKSSTANIMRLHNTCDCLVNPSYGECWGFSVIDALGVGNPTICTNTGGPEETSTLCCPSYPVPCADKGEFQFLCTANEDWRQIDIRMLQYWMRYSYENIKEESVFLNSGKKWVRANLAHKVIGEKLIELFKQNI